MVAHRTTPRWFLVPLLALGALAPACGADVASDADDAAVDDVDLSHPPVRDDVTPPDDADLSLPPEDDGTDAATTDAAVDARADAQRDAGPDVLVVLDAPIDARADVPPATDVADARVDVAPPRCTGSASGQSSIWTCTADRTARQRCVTGVVQTERCPHGCEAHPSGTDDTCAPAATTTLPACAHRALLSWGLHPDASDHLRCIGVASWRITQTIGNAAASAGTHGVDGYVSGQAYSAATDLSVRGLSASEIRTLLSRLADHGFAAWYRWPGHDGWPSSEAPHIHAIFVGARMKASLRAQVRDWLVGRNGLVSHTVYAFYTWSTAQRNLVRAVFTRANP